MPLACECEYDDYDFWHDTPNGYKSYDAKRGKRCMSCGTLVRTGDLCAEFPRWRHPKTDIEEAIHGEEVKLANGYHCERCADLFFSLDALGYCVNPYENMLDLLADYHELVREEQEDKQRERESKNHS